jgi:hypothetical protein
MFITYCLGVEVYYMGHIFTLVRFLHYFVLYITGVRKLTRQKFKLG